MTPPQPSFRWNGSRMRPTHTPWPGRRPGPCCGPRSTIHWGTRPWPWGMSRAIAYYDSCLASQVAGSDLDAVRRDAALNRRFAVESAQRAPRRRGPKAGHPLRLGHAHRARARRTRPRRTGGRPGWPMAPKDRARGCRDVAEVAGPAGAVRTARGRLARRSARFGASTRPRGPRASPARTASTAPLRKGWQGVVSVVGSSRRRRSSWGGC